MKAFITGGVGFIGSALCLELLECGWRVDVFDALTYAAAPGTAQLLRSRPRCTVTQGDIRDRSALRAALDASRPDVIFHLAAETHVDRSIDAADDFIATNVTGTFEVLEAARALSGSAAGAPVLVHVSTDEVFGSLNEADPPFNELTRYDPSSPYSASKAGGDHLARAWARTYGMDVRISNCTNNYGPRQFPEKLIPLMVLNAMRGAQLPVYGDGSNRRDWLHVEDHARGLRLVAEAGEADSVYCFGGGAELSNIEVVRAICDQLDKLRPARASHHELIAFVADRPGHDWRYAIDASKAKGALGWTPKADFGQGLFETIDWYLSNESWWAPLVQRYSGAARLGRG